MSGEIVGSWKTQICLCFWVSPGPPLVDEFIWHGVFPMPTNRMACSQGRMCQLVSTSCHQNPQESSAMAKKFFCCPKFFSNKKTYNKTTWKLWIIFGSRSFRGSAKNLGQLGVEFFGWVLHLCQTGPAGDVSKNQEIHRICWRHHRHVFLSGQWGSSHIDCDGNSPSGGLWTSQHLMSLGHFFGDHSPSKLLGSCLGILQYWATLRICLHFGAFGSHYGSSGISFTLERNRLFAQQTDLSSRFTTTEHSIGLEGQGNQVRPFQKSKHGRSHNDFHTFTQKKNHQYWKFHTSHGCVRNQGTWKLSELSWLWVVASSIKVRRNRTKWGEVRCKWCKSLNGSIFRTSHIWLSKTDCYHHGWSILSLMLYRKKPPQLSGLW